MTSASQTYQAPNEDIGRVGLTLALAVGGFLRLWNLTGPSQHTDEAYSFAIASLPIPALLQTVAAHDYHPPLFYVFTHYLIVLVPKPPWEYRYITAFFGCLTILATWGAARRIFGGIAAAVAALAVALAPALIQHDRIYRMYAVAVALTALAWWLLVECEQAIGRRKIWLIIGYTVAAAFMTSIHYLGVLMLVCQLAYAVVHRKALTPALVAAATSILVYIPWLHALLQQVPSGGIVLSRPGLDAGLAASVRGAFASGWPATSSAADVAVSCALLALAAVAAWLGRRTALPFWLAAIFVQIAGSIALAKNLAYFPRYLLVDVPAFCIALGVIVSALAGSRRQGVAAVVAAAGMGLCAVGASHVSFDPYYQFPDWYALNAFILSHEQPADAIVLDAAYELTVVHGFSAFRGRDIVPFMNPNDFSTVLGWIAQHPHRRVWYVEHQHVYWDPDRRIASALGSNRPILTQHAWPKASPVDTVSVALFGKATKAGKR